MRRFRWLLLVVTAAIACRGASSGDPAELAIPTLAFPDTVTLGGAEAEGAAALGVIRSVALLADGDHIVVADGQTQELHVFALTGEHLARISGRGGGPGEHQAIREVWGTSQGGFCTWDVQTIRVTRFDSNGKVLETGTANLKGMEAIRPAFEGFFDDCSYVLRDEREEMGMVELPEGMRQDTIRFVLFNAAGVPMRTLLTRLDTERWFRKRLNSWGRVRLVFGEELLGFTRDREFWVGTSDELRWARLDSIGDTVGVVDLHRAPRPATDAAIELERQRRIAEVPRPRSRIMAGSVDLGARMVETEREGIREVVARERIPMYDLVVPGSDGTLWIREYPAPDQEPVQWILLGPTLTAVGVVALPRRDSIVAGSMNTVVFKTRDALDAPVLQILRRQR